MKEKSIPMPEGCEECRFPSSVFKVQETRSLNQEVELKCLMEVLKSPNANRNRKEVFVCFLFVFRFPAKIVAIQLAAHNGYFLSSFLPYLLSSSFFF